MKVWHALQSAIAAEGGAVLVSIVSAAGSTPRGAGTHMIVTTRGIRGTIGGGALEWRAIAEAQKLLSSKGHAVLKIALGPELGQCCGGSVSLLCEFHDDVALARSLAVREDAGPFEVMRHGQTLRFGTDRQAVAIFGAGHVGKALALALAPLEVDVTWVDPRPDAFPTLVPENVVLVQPADPVAVLSDMRAGSIVMVMTHSHALDLALCAAALGQLQVAHVGVIGSATKRARFEKRLMDMGLSKDRVAELICPIGMVSIRSKHPAAIAAGVAAQILELQDTRTARLRVPQSDAA
jgi:xanthine dehydrogenase accessory factor